MAEIRAFKALRYTEKAGSIKENVCPPYDIISPEKREELCKRSDYNLIRLELPEGGDKYAEAGKMLDKWLEEGLLASDEEDGIYIYEEDFYVKGKRYVFDGLVCLCRAYDFSEKIVLPHENTLSKAKEDRFNLMKNTFCNFSSIYSLYTDDEKVVNKIIKTETSGKPIYEFTDDEGVTHRLWKITEKAVINKITAFFGPKQLFIADGHHRYETAGRFNKYVQENKINGINSGYVLMTLVDMEDDGLVVFPTHRLIYDMKVDGESLAGQAEKYFDVTYKSDISGIEKTLEENNGTHAYALYTGTEGYWLLRAKPECKVKDCENSDAFKKLDVTVLHSLILEEMMGIDKENMANQVNLHYTQSIEKALESVDSGESSAAFIMNSTKISEIKDVSLSGDKMPQKSTYFYPKLVTGLVMNNMKENQ